MGVVYERGLIGIYHNWKDNETEFLDDNGELIRKKEGFVCHSEKDETKKFGSKVICACSNFLLFQLHMVINFNIFQA